jgi:uncharacterized coiled-coil protein SlyX
MLKDMIKDLEDIKYFNKRLKDNVFKKIKDLKIKISEEPEFKFSLMENLTEDQLKEVQRIDNFLTELQTPLEQIENELEYVLEKLQNIV